MIRITPQKLKPSGIEPPEIAISQQADVRIKNSGQMFLFITNANTDDPNVVTIYGQRSCNTGEVHDVTVSIPTQSARVIGPFETSQFNDVEGYIRLHAGAKIPVTCNAVTYV